MLEVCFRVGSLVLRSLRELIRCGCLSIKSLIVSLLKLTLFTRSLLPGISKIPGRDLQIFFKHSRALNGQYLLPGLMRI